MRKAVEFTVPFVRGKGRPRFTRGGVVYTDAKTKRAEEAIRAAFIEAARKQSPEWSTYEPYFGDIPVRLTLITHKPLPKTTPKRVYSAFDTTRPDIDNCFKCGMDALNRIAFRDDSQVVEITAMKRDRVRDYPEETFIRVAPVECRRSDR